MGGRVAPTTPRAEFITPIPKPSDWQVTRETQFVEQDLKVSRLTATKYLNELTEGGLLQKWKVGRSNFYMNLAPNAILTGEALREVHERRDRDLEEMTCSTSPAPERAITSS